MVTHLVYVTDTCDRLATGSGVVAIANAGMLYAGVGAMLLPALVFPPAAPLGLAALTYGGLALGTSCTMATVATGVSVVSWWQIGSRVQAWQALTSKIDEQSQRLATPFAMAKPQIDAQVETCAR